MVGRSKVATKYGIVAASQPLAARAGVQILERGGNAVDAAIATNAVMGLVEPHYNGIGGDLFAIYYEAKTGKLYGLNAGGWAPTGLTPALLESKGIDADAGQRHLLGDRARRRRGLGRDARAVRQAADVRPARAGDLLRRERLPGHRRDRRRLGRRARRRSPPSRTRRRRSSSDGRAPRAGEVFKNPDLAGSLRLIAEKDAAGFYEGKTAEAILAVSREKGGTMTAADLKEYQPEWVDPISTTYRGWTVYELPPNTQGIAALMMLNLMEQFPLGEYGFHSTKALHVMIEAKKLAYADMLRYVADPKFAKVAGAADAEQGARDRARAS